MPASPNDFVQADLLLGPYPHLTAFPPVTAAPEPASAEPLGWDPVPDNQGRFVQQGSSRRRDSLEQFRFFAAQQAFPNPAKIRPEPSDVIDPLLEESEIQAKEFAWICWPPL
ncbi:hypothetical protein [Singulisphaera sp. GP187]|uniref:hypothetical protein n=1 Tax=Singulisphaera sp. GP187 TaxID=1882752 RepID=UPI0020B107DB|nr:hypothetical protein [Singulisphaera sp. GP187]